MSKGKRKNNSRPPRHSKQPAATEPDVDGSRDSKQIRQRRLLVVAFLLLGVAALMNLRRLRGDKSARPIPLPAQEIVSRPLAPRSRGSEKRFSALARSQTGVDFTHPVDDNHPMAYLYFSSTASGGIAVGDVSGDGRPDIFVASGPEENRLYIQKAEAFTFEDTTSHAGVGGGHAWGCGATMVDINADGRLDIFLANYDSPNQLFLNRGDGTFQNVAADYGLNITDASLEGAFADYDRDGDLDVYLLTYRYENPNGMPLQPPIVYRGAEREIRSDFQKYYVISNDDVGYTTVGRSDGLLRNNGDGTFSNVTSASGIHGVGHGQSVTWWDYNGDGFVDLHVGNDFNDSDRLYRNNGDATFTDVIQESVPHTTWFSMGADAGDVDGDGLIDLLSSDMSSTTHFKQKTTMGSMGDNIELLLKAVPRQYMRNALLLNTGLGRFKEAAYLSGLDSTDWTWSVKLADLDCDGKLDVFFTNGSVRSFTDSDNVFRLSERKGKTEWDLYKDTEPLREKNLAFRNDGQLRFTEVGADWGLDHLGVSMSSAHADFDGDGDLDFVVANMEERLTIYRNDSSSNNRITVRLHGRGGNRFGVGATVRVVTADGEQVRELQPTRGFLASNQPTLHFGCGAAELIDLAITWPSGGVQKYASLRTGQHYEITERLGLATAPPAENPPQLFSSKTASSGLAHQENEFDDFELQSLLPHRMSRLGPALAAGDFDGDGDMDYFVGGASGQAGRIAVKDNSGATLSLREQPALEADKMVEDMGAIWLDVDQDGDLDLFVATGGNEHEIDSTAYQLRLYTNDGKGGLQRSKDRCPDIRVSAGPVAAADFDGDGDVDLFVGGRQIPGKYPLPANSYLLMNQNGVLQDRTHEIMPSVSEVGMVTGALWSDVDNDSDLDLLTTTEWGGIHLFRNEGGTFIDDSAQAGLTGHQGWWTGITGSDLDADGDIDYIATNLGLNTKYHASDEHPYRIFYGDFEGSGQRKLVEAEYENETLFPVRGKSCSTHAMPSLGDKFTTYRDFASASLQEIYTPQCLDDSYQCSATWLSSVALINDGLGGFRFEPLPMDAQLSPGFGVIITELNGDGIPDVFMAQNFFSPQPETGNMDGGLGCVLAGIGDGRFVSLSTRETGIVIPDDATSAVVAELNGDQLPDLLVATNNGALRVMESNAHRRAAQVPGETSTVAVILSGVRSTAEIAGARIAFQSETKEQMVEVSAGNGYLSQQPPLFFFAGPAGERRSVRVTWPDGRVTERPVDPGTQSVTIAYRR